MNNPLVTLRENGIIVRRRQRYDEEAWQGARSWLGGLPHISPEHWPRHSGSHAPLYHLAQINLADLPDGPWSSYLPKTGALCFFYDVDQDEYHTAPTTVYVPNPESRPPCQPPDDCKPFGGEDNWRAQYLNRDRTRYEDAHRVMPHWPVDFVAVNCEEIYGDDGREVVFDPSLKTILGPHPEYVPTPPPKKGLFITPICLENEVPWEAARRVVVAVQNNSAFDPAVDTEPGLAAKLKEIGGAARRRHEATRDFLEQWEPRIAQHDPYAIMPEDQAQAFIAHIWTLRRSKTLSPRENYSVTNLCCAGRDIYLEMLLGPRDMYEKMPPQVRDRIQNERRKILHDGSHQMFGQGRDLQGYLDDKDTHFLLLELNFDSEMHWKWGDLGSLQFFITPQDLAARNWDAVTADYTCG